MPSPEFLTRLDEGLRLFRAAQFFEAHEAWEAGWKVTRGSEKQLLQVLVLWAGAFHHGRGDNRVGAVTLAKRALEKLEAVPTARAPFDLDVLRDALTQSWEGLSSEGPLRLVPPPWEPTPVEEPATEVELTQRSRCPYCGEPVAVEVDPALAGGAEYVEDCPVCCNPWTVVIRDDGGQLAVTLQRGDE